MFFFCQILTPNQEIIQPLLCLTSNDVEKYPEKHTHINTHKYIFIYTCGDERNEDRKRENYPNIVFLRRSIIFRLIAAKKNEKKIYIKK